MDFKNIDKVINVIKEKFGNGEELLSKKFFMCKNRAVLFYLNGITDTEKINYFILIASKSCKCEARKIHKTHCETQNL